MKTWFNAKRDAGSKVASIRIFDQIGKNWFGEGTGAKDFTEAVDALGGDLETLNVHINSPGGNVYEGLAIYNYLKRHQAEVVVYVDGIAASIASIIAMAGDRIVIPANAAIFIHNPFTWAQGDANALRKTADELEAMTGSLLGIYMTRSKLDAADVTAMMNAETMITAEEAVEWGFADEIEDAIPMAANTAPPEAAPYMARMAMQMSALETQVAQLTALLAESNATVESLHEQLADVIWVDEEEELMDAEDIIAMVEEMNAPQWLATQLIKAQSTEFDVDVALEMYAEYSGLSEAAGIPHEHVDAALQQHWGSPAELMAKLLIDAKAATDPEISNRQVPGGPSQEPQRQLDVAGIYAARKPQSSK